VSREHAQSWPGGSLLISSSGGLNQVYRIKFIQPAPVPEQMTPEMGHRNTN